LTISSLLNLVSKMIQDENKHDNFPVWILQTLPQALIKTDTKVVDKYVMYTKLEQSKWFVNFTKTYADNLSSSPVVTGTASSAGSIFTDGKQHNLINDGTLVMGNSSAITPDDIIREDFPHKVDVKKFYMSVSEVTNSEYYKFTRENPEWMQSNIKELLDKKLVTDSYLRTWKNDKPEDSALNLPVTEISYYAAHAYCEWLSKKGPAGLKVRLPYESEWEYIVKSDEQVSPIIYPETPKKGPQPAATSANDRFGLKNIYGNVWTWCENWFFPASYPLYDSKNPDYTDAALAGAEKSIRGGSWANVKADGLRSYTRASLMPDFCNPYTGFRTVIADN
jgi:formylglycine-generating enzyme required for sulfatase activity